MSSLVSVCFETDEDIKTIPVTESVFDELGTDGAIGLAERFLRPFDCTCRSTPKPGTPHDQDCELWEGINGMGKALGL